MGLESGRVIGKLTVGGLHLLPVQPDTPYDEQGSNGGNGTD